MRFSMMPAALDNMDAEAIKLEATKATALTNNKADPVEMAAVIVRVPECH